MNKIYLTLLLLAYAAGVFSQNNLSMNKDRYEDEWIKVVEFEQKSLPRSASKVVDNILRKAIAEKNSPQVIKALIHKGKYELTIDAENDTIVFVKLNEMLLRSTDNIEKSVLHSLLGELYLQYYHKYRHEIDRRTILTGYVPSNMKEWTRNIFFDKIVEHLNTSLAPHAELERTKVETYATVVELGKDSRRFFPSMYDFLTRRAIDFFKQLSGNEDLSITLVKKNIQQELLFAPAEVYINLPFDPSSTDYHLWTLETYRKLLRSLLECKMDESVLLVELDKLEHLRNLPSAFDNYALPALEKLLSRWETNPMSVEIIDKIADFYLNTSVHTLAYRADDSVQVAKNKKAYELLKKGIEQFPRYERISILQNKLNVLTHPSLVVEGRKTFTPRGEKKLKVTYRNLQKVTAKLYCITAPVSYRSDEGLMKNERKVFVKDIVFELPTLEPYRFGEASFFVDIHEYGTYKLEFETDKKTDDKAACYFSVSDLSSFSRALDSNNYEFFAVNRVTGKPIKKAQIHLYSLKGDWKNRYYRKENVLITDKSGRASFNLSNKKEGRDLFYRVVSGKDSCSLLSPVPYRYEQYVSGESSRETVNLFTDRNVYRPGQTVFFKVIATRTDGRAAVLHQNKTLEVVLKDANMQEVAKQRLKTNEFGSVAGEFVLPRHVLSGYFQLVYEDQVVGFRVEEYKRPTFEVIFDKISQTYAFGEEITLKGKAESFSGIKIRQAGVNYRILRRQPWWRSLVSSSEYFDGGTVVTDERGEFEIRFIPRKSDVDPVFPAVYTFSVEAVVTDINGESQRGNYDIVVGDVSMMLDIEMTEKWEKNEAPQIVFSAKNLDGNEIATKGTYRVFSLSENDSISQQVLEGNFVTGEQMELRAKLGRLSSGKYCIRLLAEDDKGNTVEAEKKVVLFSYADKKPPYKTNEWLVEKNTTFGEGVNSEIILGVSDKDVPVLFEIWQGNKLHKREWVTLSEENRTFRIPYQAQLKDQASVVFTYIKNEKFYSHRVDLQVEKEKKELGVKLSVFRDKIRPGTQEEWRLTVTDVDGKPARAEVLASMYDFSLDKIYPTTAWEWKVSDGREAMNRVPLIYKDVSFDNEFVTQYFPFDEIKIVPFVFDTFNWFGFSLFSRSDFMTRGLTSDIKGNLMGMASTKKSRGDSEVFFTSAPEVNFQSDRVAKGSEEKAEPIGGQSKLPGFTDIYQSRRNFNEAAFFFPQLRTDDKGETQLAFTVPESNTRWRFRVLAHDKKLNVGQIEAFAVSQKELMVTTNMPRFFLQGDKTGISAKISNLSDRDIAVNVKIEFFNPMTNEVISNIAVQQEVQTFSLAKGASSAASWMVDVPADIDVLGVRIIAENESFSDSEQHAIAVLPNRMLATESMRLDVQANETKEFTMDRLANRSSDTARPYRLTLEFASNPAWYAIQALPVMSNPESDNAVSWFASYYANTLGYHISQAYPQVAAMIEVWKKQSFSEETFLSNLQKNEELKNVLLEETPWVLEAKNEAEQKEKLSLLFDPNRSNLITRQAVDKLRELQTSEGGWSWFKDFRSSRSITQYILYGFSQLKELKAVEFTDDIRTMQAKAVSYIDSEALRSFELFKKQDKNWRNIKTISTPDLEYLYVRSAYTQYASSKEVQEMVNFYTGTLVDNWTKYGLYERSLIALLMSRRGKQSVVTDILNSFREHATVNNEMGMFWANDRSNVFMSQSAISVHTFIMDAFRIGGAKSGEMDNMKRWLLKQKQTEIWESTHATVDAIFALLSTGGNWFSSQGETAIKIGEEVVKSDNQEQGTGYFKKSWNGSEIKPEMGKIQIVHQGNTPAWGALYWQYFEEIDKIANTDASLDIEKALFIEQTGVSGKELVPVTENHPLKTGDKVVIRLTVRTDRDMEFVHLKDLRAACFEPIDQISGTYWQGKTRYYRTSKDASTHFYFDHMPRGTYVFEYGVFVNRAGSYSNGTATIQCLYAPEFTSHTSGIRINVKE
ncbi:alpha-2-macroglobulin family protein [Anaerorudis cellulosivorans]|uniref:alpha-2-macroglobulin family protein n=1 Tax=Anaerorudis cellulosivorans TaxID=3397862 RepID=UPI00221F6144|nr:alpha-2-macroglobulin family protein [Seramator thermalis]MCW1735431.1 MG2 domain-containing protein [Seramator thermalis]